MTTATLTLESLRQQRETLLARGEIASLQREIPQLERWASGMELQSSLAEEVGRWIGHDPNFADPEFAGRRMTPIDSVADRSFGQDRLLFQSEYDLARMRGFARILTNEVAPAISVLQNLDHYIIGTNWKYEVEPADDTGDEKIASSVNNWWKRWLKLNRWIGSKHRDREAYRRAKRDGETFIRLQPLAGGMSRVRFCEPAWIQEPAGYRSLEDALIERGLLPDLPLSWTFGVVTPANDPETELGYHVVRDETGRDWEFLPASQCVHIKAVTDSNVKRGVSEFHPVYSLLTSGEKVFDRAAYGAIIQASIAYVTQEPPGTRLEQMTGVNSLGTRTQSTGEGGASGSTRQIDQKKFGRGTILAMSHGRQFEHGPMGTQRNSMILLAGQAALRLAAVRWNMPEWMVSGDASNNNYSSSLVAEDPFVKTAEAEQSDFASDAEELFWKALRIAYDAGIFRSLNVEWEQVEAAIQLVITPTPLQSRDIDKLTQETVALVSIGVMDRQTAAERHDLEWETVKQRQEEQVASMVDAANGLGFGAGAI